MRECQLLVARADTDAYAAILDQYLASIMGCLRRHLEAGSGEDEVKTTLKLWRQFHSTLAAVVTKPYLGYIKVQRHSIIIITSSLLISHHIFLGVFTALILLGDARIKK